MLVLTRKKDQSVLIGEDIKITILGMEGDRIRIGIDAPQSMQILRKELVDEAGMINREAVHTPVDSLADIVRAMDGK